MKSKIINIGGAYQLKLSDRQAIRIFSLSAVQGGNLHRVYLKLRNSALPREHIALNIKQLLKFRGKI